MLEMLLLFASTVAKTYRVTAAVDTKVRSHGDSTAEVEESVDDVESDHDHRVAHERVLGRRGDQVEQRQHRKDCKEHVVVDN